MTTLSDADIIRRLADGEKPWVIDPEHGCVNPLTGYYPSREVRDELDRRQRTADTRPPAQRHRPPHGGYPEVPGPTPLQSLFRRAAAHDRRLARARETTKAPLPEPPPLPPCKSCKNGVIHSVGGDYPCGQCGGTGKDLRARTPPPDTSVAAAMAYGSYTNLRGEPVHDGDVIVPRESEEC